MTGFENDLFSTLTYCRWRMVYQSSPDLFPSFQHSLVWFGAERRSAHLQPSKIDPEAWPIPARKGREPSPGCLAILGSDRRRRSPWQSWYYKLENPTFRNQFDDLPSYQPDHKAFSICHVSYTYMHCIALHCVALHCIALHCIALHCIALHYITLHYITLHYITLHTHTHTHTYVKK